MTFLFPMILAAAGAAIAPVIIHLVMRTRPRRIVFPAMRFVRKIHQGSLRKRKLKHLILLLMRIAIILLVAVLIARMHLPWKPMGKARGGPVGAVVIIDNSGSMTTHLHGESLLDSAKRWAIRVLQSLPSGSRLAVLCTEGSDREGVFRSDRKLLEQRIAEIPPTFASVSVAPALKRAVRMLESVEIPRKEVYLVCDMTKQCWRDDPGVGKVEDVDFICLDVGAKEVPNIALGIPRVSPQQVPPGAEVSIQTDLSAARVGSEVTLRLVDDGGAPLDSRTTSAVAGRSVPVRFVFPVRTDGVVHASVVLDHPDPLEMDNRRYFTVEVVDPPLVWVVRDRTTIGKGDETSFLMANAVCPGGLEPGVARWARREIVSPDRLHQAQLEHVRIVLLCNVSSLSSSQWETLERFIRRGGHLWVVTGPLVSSQGYNQRAAQRVLPVSLGAAEELVEPLGWDTRELHHPMLQPFAGDANPPLDHVLHNRRFSIQSLSGDPDVVLRFSDGVPAIVLRKLGDGSVTFWNFSPVRQFSDLGQLPQFPILTQRTVRLLGGDSQMRTMYGYGQRVVAPVPQSLRSPTVTVYCGREKTPLAVEIDSRNNSVALKPDRPGHWTLEFTDRGRSIRRGFSVNVDPTESDLAAVDPDRVKAMFPLGKVAIVSDLKDLDRTDREGEGQLDVSVPLLLLLLVLLVAESMFSNRFHRRADQAAPTQHPQQE